VEPRASLDASVSDPGDTVLAVRREFERAARAGEAIFEPGEPGDALYVVQAGEVALFDAAPGTPRLVARLGPGEPLGEIDALLGRTRGTRAIALSDARLLRLDRTIFEAMCHERPDIAVQVMERLAARLAALEERLVALGMNDLVRPVARELLRCARPDGAGARAELTLRALAAAAGLSLREAHRGLQELVDRKLVRLVDDALTVPDCAALLASVGDDPESTRAPL
jgi:CRP/FNR family cyclic AMP-dependent transcriptional regulator